MTVDLGSRTLWYRDLKREDDENYEPTSPGVQCDGEDDFLVPNLVSSLCDDELHRPALDFDFPVTVVESSTPGHHHVYIDKPMTWERYQLLLVVLREVGLLEEGYVSASLERKMTMLRLPGVTKGGDA